MKMEIPEIWSFLIGRTYAVDDRTIVAPRFLCETSLAAFLAEEPVEGNITETDPEIAYYREIHGTKVGDLTLVFRVIKASPENTGIEGIEIIRDEHGRQLPPLIEGIVCKGLFPDVFISQDILETVHSDVIVHYKKVWQQKIKTPAAPSDPLDVNSEGEKLEYKVLKNVILSNKSAASKIKAIDKLDLHGKTSKEKLKWDLFYCSNPFKNPIVSVSFSSDGKLFVFRQGNNIHFGELDIILSGSEDSFCDRTTKVYDNCELLGYGFKDYSPAVVSKNGDLITSVIVCGLELNMLKVWNTKTAKEETFFSCGSQATFMKIRAIAITPDCKTLITGNIDSVINVWDTKTGGKFSDFSEHSDTVVTSISICNNGKTIVSGDQKGVIIIWDLDTKKSTHTINAHEKKVNSISISPDDKTFISCSNDTTIKLWDIQTGKKICDIGSHLTFANAVDFSSDGKFVISGGHDKKIKIWNLSNQQLEDELEHKDEVTTVCFIPDTKMIVSGSCDGKIRFWQPINK